MTEFWQSGAMLEVFPLSFLFLLSVSIQVHFLKYTLARGLFEEAAGLVLERVKIQSMNSFPSKTRQ